MCNVFNMSSVPLVSVIIPVYNAEKTIMETLNSVVSQTYTNLEIICVDDGSSDNSVAIIEHFEDSRIKILHRKSTNKGGSVCRNIGANSSNGKYLIFLDADDCLATDCIESRVRIIEPSICDFVVFPVGYFSLDISDYCMYKKLSSANPLYCFAAASPAWQTMQAIIRKELFVKINGFDEKYQRFQDVEFYLRAMFASKDSYKIVNTKVPDCFFRHNGSSGYFTPSKLKSSIDSCCYLFDLVVSHSSLFNDKKKLYLVYVAIISNYKLFSFLMGYKDNKDIFIHRSCYHEICQSFTFFERIGLDFMLNFKKNHFSVFFIKAVRKLIDYVLY